MTSVELTPEAVASYDAVLISTNHSSFDYRTIAAHAHLIIDTRDAMRPYVNEIRGRLVRA